MQNDLQFIHYLQEVTGNVPEIKSLPDDLLRKLPFFIRDNYQLQIVSLIEKQFIRAVVDEDSSLTPAQLQIQSELIQKVVGVNIVFEFSKLPAYLRQRLVQKHIAFVVPGTQLFIPFLVMDIRSKTRGTMPVNGNSKTPFTAPAQLLLLYHLQCENIERYTFGELSKKTGYSLMTLSRIVKEFSSKNVCEIIQDGVRKYIKFFVQGKLLWEKIVPYLQNPILEVALIKYDRGIETQYVNAGMTALSRYTSLADDSTQTIALFNHTWSDLKAKEGVVEIQIHDGDSIRVEIWRYDPCLLAKRGSKTIDRLSLYLTCREHNDERVQIALEQLLKEMAW
ncbi:MAG: hypothetical protein GX639_02910 [Fibrobacter sp.]|nr:hypothetical protein [Fibrobacter sp.]